MATYNSKQHEVVVPLSKGHVAQLTRIMASMQQLIADANSSTLGAGRSEGPGSTRTRRSGKELIAFKREIRAERKAGASVAELATKHGVTPSYIYQL